MGKKRFEHMRQMNIKMPDSQFQQLCQICDMLGVARSDFVRTAVSSQMNIVLIQQVLLKFYDFFRTVDLSALDEETLKEVDAYMQMLEKITGQKSGGGEVSAEE